MTLAYLRSPQAIRDRCNILYELACQDKLQHFRVDLSQLETTADYVLQVIREHYPNLDIPFHSRWQHFEVGGISRIAQLNAQLASLPPIEQAKAKYDLAIISVLLDAGAGAAWKYQEAETGGTYQRSEGLAVASLRMFERGLFSSSPQNHLQADAEGLKSLTESRLAAGFQVSSDNPLVGLSGRLQLLQKLGQSLTHYPDYFGSDHPRPGNLVSYFLSQAENKQISASFIFTTILTGLGEIWPGRLTLEGVNLGDVWQHSALPDAGYIPFHKLSQWLTYSLLEPLQEIGLEITQLNALTGLPEYRNGGLCLDLGLLQPKSNRILEQAHQVDSEVIVEWRSLTVILLDKIAQVIRKKLQLSETELPLVKVLQGGTWTAGRKIAAELRPGGIPPIQIDSDGTVF
ncbi:URC4/urg3 family protein [Desertifilum sp. FACHB-1129]|uniref:Uracil phosphoribosyltransferase n=1 Tax=Desertifilum tharense IPPAS B-1220 TaxID=1781255 RepID=A0A1E5QNW7_9CYAN|nr:MULTISPECIES: URC4/urg3 family protein [Desertifilum]MDA0208570.1 URC4/urg3 family protein [Cyanobacteria bacterium FC1]MBD2312392.1 URC4/urg3 family protein [Desertifilum sp. FACHB-1129]MBD2321175.1 URC4/urg3 family protein [Desertifilum sp. FACHB-866]MBD2331518.1 URC4/urg3 family protein [Desertifilum sp. FACHB-868]OEJ76033.1 uracil phosphoribosyltransferase [Desertifilum tharense IPPAS B-1220]